jgi:hypothetical protein
VKGSGGMGMMLLMIAIGVGAWALGRTQTDGGPGPGGGGGAGTPPPGGSHSNARSGGYAGGPAPGHGPAPHSGPAGGEQPKSGWQRSNPPPGTSGASSGTASGAAKGAWEKAREETKRKEEERKAKEAEKKRKEDLEKRLKEAREKEAREREVREKLAREREKEAREKLAREKEAREMKERLAREKEASEMKERLAREKEAREMKERLAREKEAREMKERLAREKEDRERKERLAREKEARETKAKEEAAKSKGSMYAFSAVGEKTNPWPQGQPPAARSTSSSPTKKPPAPTAKTYLGTEEDAYSFRPYDRPKKPMHKKSHSSLYSESSYAASHSTSRTTPPPSNRGPYSTKDPDKIVIKAVYAFNNAFLKTPTSQLVSGVGSVTDGLILRITTEGLFIDDDVRGVPQREWDVKAWTMKLVEVWCPSFRQGPAGISASARFASHASSLKRNHVRRLWGMDKDKAATSEEIDALLVDMLQLCQDRCRLRATSSASSENSASTFDDRSSIVSDSAYGSSVGSSSPENKKTNGVSFQTGELKSARLHVLRASIRDQEGKKYVFVITEEENWKVAVGLQRLRRGTQVRALGVSGMSANDARGTLENLGWA